MRNYESFRGISRAYLYGAAIAVLLGLGQAVEINMFWDIADRYYHIINKSRRLWTYATHLKAVSFWPESGNTFGSYMAVSVIMLMGFGRDVFKKYGLWIILLAAGMLVSISFTSIGAFFIVLPAVLYFAAKNFGKKYAVNAGLCILAALVLTYILIPGKINKRIQYKLTMKKENPLIVRGLNRRAECWDEAIKDEFDKREYLGKLIGVGYAGASAKDNYYIELLGTGGMVSLAVFISLSLAIIGRCIRSYIILRKEKKDESVLYSTSVMIFAAVLIMCITGSYISYFPVVIPMLLSVSAANLEEAAQL
ncbi:MAG: hypothetical protein JXJ19_03060 [Elusimicrobia bacterium]|nr:hypothetical protein [Elusimicrobiota bacterium]